MRRTDYITRSEGSFAHAEHLVNLQKHRIRLYNNSKIQRLFVWIWKHFKRCKFFENRVIQNIKFVFCNISAKGAVMAGYVVVQVDIHDPEGFAVYRDMVPPTLEVYGGQYLVRGGDFECLEGEWDPQRLVIIEFESYERAKAWWESEEYAPAKRLREKTARSKLIVIKGLAD